MKKNKKIIYFPAILILIPNLLSAENGSLSPNLETGAIQAPKDPVLPLQPPQHRTSLSDSNLWDAAQSGNLSLVKGLLLKGSSDPLHQPNSHGKTPLDLAAERGHQGVVNLLLGLETKPERCKHSGDLARKFFKTSNDPETKKKADQILNLFREHSQSLEEASINQYTPLIRASKRGDAELVQLLLEKGSNPNVSNPWGETPLMAAAGSGNPTTVELLLKHQAKVNHEDNHHHTALNEAINQGHREIVALLLKNKARVDHLDPHQNTPLMHAARTGDPALIQLLLDHGAQVNATNFRQDTPLIEAVRSASPSAVDLLLSHGANAQHRNIEKKTALDEIANSTWEAHPSHLNPQIEIYHQIMGLPKKGLLKKSTPEVQGSEKLLNRWKNEAKKRQEERHIEQINGIQTVLDRSNSTQLNPNPSWGAGESIMRLERSHRLTLSVNRLDQRYPSALPNQKYALHALYRSVAEFDPKNDGEKKLKKAAAIRFLNRVFAENENDFVEEQPVLKIGKSVLLTRKREIRNPKTHLSVAQYLALNWYAMNDRSLYPTENDRLNKLWGFIEAAAHIQRAHNDHAEKKGQIEWRVGLDHPSCIQGTFTRLVEHFSDVHPDVLMNELHDEQVREDIRQINQTLAPAYFKSRPKDFKEIQSICDGEDPERQPQKLSDLPPAFLNYRKKLIEEAQKASPLIDPIQLERVLELYTLMALFDEAAEKIEKTASH
ncbi:MAG: ankyrin repeat domain-containing protein [Bdellovibrionia bacterium]